MLLNHFSFQISTVLTLAKLSMAITFAQVAVACTKWAPISIISVMTIMSQVELSSKLVCQVASGLLINQAVLQVNLQLGCRIFVKFIDIF